MKKLALTCIFSLLMMQSINAFADSYAIANITDFRLFITPETSGNHYYGYGFTADQFSFDDDGRYYYLGSKAAGITKTAAVAIQGNGESHSSIELGDFMLAVPDNYIISYTGQINLAVSVEKSVNAAYLAGTAGVAIGFGQYPGAELFQTKYGSYCLDQSCDGSTEYQAQSFTFGGTFPSGFVNDGALFFNRGYSTLTLNLAADVTQGGYEVVAAVPEPETYGLFLSGLSLLGLLARRRKVTV